MNTGYKTLYEQYKTTAQNAADLNYAAAVLGWDQETYMPPNGADGRGRQLATLSSEAHKMLTSDSFGNLLNDLIANAQDADATDGMRSNISIAFDDYTKNKKLPAEFVGELSLLTSQSFNAWVEARNRNEFSVFEPFLDKMVGLKRRQADLYGYTTNRYDALLNEYERGASTRLLDKVFDTVRIELPPILEGILSCSQVSNDIFHKDYDRQRQWDFSIDVLKKMGFDFASGRQDYSEHPFTTSFNARDVRITTRIDTRNFASLLWSSIHEGGHGLYEQGLPDDQYGLPLGEAASLGIHESQSRIWENCIGRGKPFWNHFFPVLSGYFPEQLSGASAETIYKACNRVSPSFIRTEADELTYHFHVLIRYEIEKALIAGELSVKDLPSAWNEAYRKYLGITPPDFKQGVLQDVHWSHGMFGYFPTYTLGSFYAVQFFDQACKELPGLENQIGNGLFSDLLNWLREKIHRHGRRYTSEELCTRITGYGLDPQAFIRYANHKYGEIYTVRSK